MQNGPGTERQRERARLAQQRSRARRRREVEILEARVKSLTSAVDELVDNSVRFSDAAVSAAQQNECASLSRSLKLFVARALAVAQTAAGDDEGIGDNVVTDNGQHPPPVREKTAESRSESPTSTAPEHARGRGSTRLQLVPFMPYGLLPTFSGCDSPPPDVLENLDPQTAPFAALLFWNTMAFARLVLEDPSSYVTRHMFSYVMPFTSAERQRKQIGRRLGFKPNSIPLLISFPHSAGMRREDIEQANVNSEAETMRKDFEDISQAMAASADRMSSYLNAAEVEARLISRWGISTALLTAYRTSTQSRQSLGRVLNMFVQATKCLGDKPGYPIRVVDAAAIYLYSGTLTE